MDATTTGALVAAVLSSGLLTAVANNVWQRRRQRADTAAVLNETALELVVPLRGEIKELRGEITAYRQRIGILERRERELIQTLAVHAAWDMQALSMITAAGLELPALPALFPQTSHRERTRAEDYDLPDTRTGEQA